MVDLFVWLFVILTIVGLLTWLTRMFTGHAPAAGHPAPVRQPPPPPPAVAPGYLRKWDGTRQWVVREDKMAWDRAFEQILH